MLAKRRSKAIQVVGLGQACVDYLGRIEKYPGEDEKIELQDLNSQCGGPASTALVALSRLGVPTSFLGSISDDPFGEIIQKGLTSEGVDITFLKISPGYRSQFAFIAINQKDGKRTIFWIRGSVPPLAPPDVDLNPFPDAQILHVDSLMVEAGIEAARQARAKGLTVVMDAGTFRPGAAELMALVDVLIASETFAGPLLGRKVSPQEALRKLRAMGPREAVITLGPKGSIGLNEKGIHLQHAYPVRALDTTGAGDVYHGAYIYGLLQSWELPECMHFASAASALKCKVIGAQKGIPSKETVMGFMEENPMPLQIEKRH